MLNLEQIRRALAAQLKDALDTKLNVYAYLPEDPRIPCIAVMSATDEYVAYHTTMSQFGTADVRLEIHVIYASRAEDAQIAIDNLLSVGTGSTSSIHDAVLADPSLGGLVEECDVLTSHVLPRGEENAGVFEAVIPVRFIAQRD